MAQGLQFSAKSMRTMGRDGQFSGNNVRTMEQWWQFFPKSVRAIRSDGQFPANIVRTIVHGLANY